jgi:hypothetical protein
LQQWMQWSTFSYIYIIKIVNRLNMNARPFYFGGG